MKRIVAEIRWVLIYYDKWEYTIVWNNKEYKWESTKSLIDQMNKDIDKARERELDRIEYYSHYYD